MTKTYSTIVTISDKVIIVESLVNNQRFIDTAPRGINENIAVAEFCIRHKQRADVLLVTDTPQNIEARKLVDLQHYSSRDIYGVKA